MIRSMTGFGKAEKTLFDNKILIEVKSLNSKQLDLSLKIPPDLRPVENHIRQQSTNIVLRGKAEVLISIQGKTEKAAQKIDIGAVKAYHDQFQTLAQTLDIPLPVDIFNTLVQLPGIFSADENDLSEQLISHIMETLKEALEGYDKYRIQEGKALKEDLLQHIEQIRISLQHIEPLEEARKEAIKQRIYKGLQEVSGKESLDLNRFEQEMIYYLERLDITEEKVRLSAHCRYFLDTLDEYQAGRKLSFIAQEIGREINTIGSKANEANIQRLVVTMKDELEKIKEQLHNIL